MSETESQPTSLVDSKSGATDTQKTTDDNFEPQLTAAEYAEKWRKAGQEAAKNRKKAAELAGVVEELKTRLQEFESVVQTKGDTESQLKREREMRERIEKEKKQLEAQFAFKAVSSEFERAAIQRGCVDPKALTTLAKNSGLFDELMIEDDFSVQGDSLKLAMERAEKEYQYLFSKRAPTFRDGVPNSSTQAINNAKPDFTKMKSAEEIIAWARANANKLS